MNVKSKARVVHRKQKPERTRVVGVLGQFHCDNLVYDLTIPIEFFDTRAFFKTTKIGKGESWSTVLPSDNPNTEYHVHFRGRIESKTVRMTIEYWNGGMKRTDRHPEPSAESIMRWIGSFVRDPGTRAFVVANFEKPADSWQSRFNLPFKVTMAGAEVVIDGVSLVLPRNQFRAMNAFVTKLDKALGVSMTFMQPLEFSKFKVGDDLVQFNDAIKMIVEQV